MEYGKFTKLNNFMQSFRRWVLAIMMFLPIIITFSIMLIVIGQKGTSWPLYIYPIILTCIISVIWGLYIADTILKLRNKFERQISDLKLDPPDRFDRESVIEWWKNTEPLLALRIADLISRAHHAHKTATYLATKPNGEMISQRDLNLITNLGENANLLVQYYKFYCYMEKFPNTYPSGQMFLG